MSRTRTRAAAPGKPASTLPTAEPHELETYGKDNPLKTAAEALTAAASLINEATAEEATTPAGASARPLPVEDTKFEFKNNTVPEWAKIPATAADGSPFRFPKGRKVFFLRFRANLTSVPGRGERQAILWEMSPGDLEFARTRSQGDRMKMVDQMTLQCIRAIDGLAVDWATGGAVNNPVQFWAEVGQGYRTLIQTLASQVNMLNAAETRDFLENCTALVIATG